MRQALSLSVLGTLFTRTRSPLILSCRPRNSMANVKTLLTKNIAPFEVSNVQNGLEIYK